MFNVDNSLYCFIAVQMLIGYMPLSELTANMPKKLWFI
jgi:hypothetical protein